MLVIRQEQLEVFRQAAFSAFENEMVVHSQELSPRLCKVIGEEQLRAALRQAMSRASGYGFTNRGTLRLYIELMFLCGSGFDTDPQYPEVGAILKAPGDQMLRAEQIHEGACAYQEKVSGPKNVNVHRALEALLVFAQEPLTLSPNHFVAEMLQEMTRIFPAKAAYVGEQGLTALIHEGSAEARKYHFPPARGDGLLVALMFGFGHGCTDDPLYPWIARTLQDERIVDPAARAQRLEKKAVTWLEHVVAANREGGSS